MADNQVPFVTVGAHVTNNSLSSAATLTVPATANGIRVQCATQNVRYRLDNVDPTGATNGFLIIAGSAPETIFVQPGQRIRFLEVAATAVLQYQFIRFLSHSEYAR